jgi:hypothetical protein
MFAVLRGAFPMKSSMVGQISKVALAIGVVGAIAVSASSLAKPPRPGSGCPRFGIFCLDVYDPVDCINRFGQPQSYPNSCYAYVDCATGCVGGGAQ